MAQSESPKTTNLASREVEGSSSEHRDEIDLARLGKRSVLKVRYSPGLKSHISEAYSQKAQLWFHGCSGF